MLLGDLGAEVIKIEEPEAGDESRAFGPPFVGGESAYYLSVNRNKRGCAINLKDPAGVDLVKRLVLQCDVLLENFRPGTMERLGLDHAQLLQLNPRLIFCSITGFGSSGPDAQRPGYDLIIQGEAGIMDITGEADGLPTKIGTSMADLVTGQFAVQGILAALLARTTTGVGTRVEVSMLDCMASLLTFNAGIFFSTGQSPKRRGNTHATISPYEAFQTSDGWINIGVANDKFWQLFCGVIERPDLQQDPRYRKAADRVSRRSELVPVVAAEIARHPKQHWAALLRAAGVPYGNIRSVQEVCEAEQLTSRGMVVEMQHPTAGVVRNINSPIRYDGVSEGAHAPPPLLGQHTGDILAGLLAMTAAEILALETRGVIRQGQKVAHG